MPPVVFRGALLIDGTDAPPSPNATVVVDGSKIARVIRDGPSPDLPLGTEVVDCAGKVLMPGLINCHDHTHNKSIRTPQPGRMQRDISAANAAHSPATRALITYRNALDQLREGVTTICDCGAQNDVSIDFRNVLKKGILFGPRMVAAGVAICMTGGHGYKNLSLVADGPDAVRAAARERIRLGADLVKLMATGGLGNFPDEHPNDLEYSVAELRAGAEEARNHGKPSAAHCYATQGIKNCVEAGIDRIEHGVYLDGETAAAMAARGMAVVPTVAGLALRAAYAKNSGDVAMYDTLMWMVVEPHRQAVRHAMEAGVLIGAGTDSSARLHEEIEALVDAGMPNARVLQTATGDAARLLRIEKETGTISEGKEADLLLLDGNPLERISAIRHASLVMRAGRRADLGV